MAETWVGLLRAVNLGKHNKVPMAGLRGVFEAAGCEDVRTYIQSGNVLFRHRRPDRAALEAAVAQAFGVETTIVLRTAGEVAEVAAAHPFGADTSSSHVLFLAEKPERARLRELLAAHFEPEEVAAVRDELAVLYPNGLGRSKLSAARLEKLLGVAGTMRTWRTVTRLAELAAVD